MDRSGPNPSYPVLIERDFRFPADRSFTAAFGIGQSGATLVRPDGIVAWRAQAGPDAAGAACIRRLTSARY